MPRPTPEVIAALRTVLLEDWDPHNAAGDAAASSTYDTYLAPLYDLIASGATAAQVVEFLHEREKESMCFPSLGTGRLERVARRLITAAGTG